QSLLSRRDPADERAWYPPPPRRLRIHLGRADSSELLRIVRKWIRVLLVFFCRRLCFASLGRAVERLDDLRAGGLLLLGEGRSWLSLFLGRFKRSGCTCAFITGVPQGSGSRSHLNWRASPRYSFGECWARL